MNENSKVETTVPQFIPPTSDYRTKKMIAEEKEKGG